MMNKNIKTDTRSEMIYSVNNNFKFTKGLVRRFHNSDIKLNPWFITGFSDAESCFIIRISKNSKYKTGWKIEARFQIGLHQKDLALLKLIQKFFNEAGTINNQAQNMVEYRVTSKEDLINIIIPHFDKYKLLTNKQVDF